MRTVEHLFVAVFLTTTAAYAQEPSGPIIWDGRSNALITGLTVSNPDGPCILLRNGSRKIRIENNKIGPCGGHGIYVIGGGEITVGNNYIHDTAGYGVAVEFANDLTITGNRLERNSTGVYVSRGQRIAVENNRFLNVQGPHPAGAFVQFSEVRGTGNRIRCNVGVNILGQSNPEDAINIYASSGTADDPIQVTANRIKGGGPSRSGGGINLGDTGGSYIVARDNVLANPGQYGIAVSGGTGIIVQNNTVYARQQEFTNVGITAWRAYPGIACTGVSIMGNVINWRNATGEPTPFWTDGKCGNIDWSTNQREGDIDESIFDLEIPACAATPAPTVAAADPDGL